MFTISDLFSGVLTSDPGYEPGGLECIHSFCIAVSGLLQAISTGYNGTCFKPISVFFGGDEHQEM